MSDILQVQTTLEAEEDAVRLGRALVEERLAACAQVVGPLRSVYRWRGEVVEATEWLCLLKTQEDRYGELEARLRGLHPYEEPEIVAVRVSEGSAGYLRWVAESTVADSRGAGGATSVESAGAGAQQEVRTMDGSSSDAERFDAKTLAVLDGADEVDIETVSPSGVVHRVIIWVVVEDGDVYVRSVRGAPARWYRELTARQTGALHVDGRRIPVRAVPAADEASVEAASRALRRKYARSRSSLAAMVRPEVLETTLRLTPG